LGICDHAGKFLHRRGLGRIQAEGGTGHQAVLVDAGGDVPEHGSSLFGGELPCPADMQPEFSRRSVDDDTRRGPACGFIVIERRHDFQ